MTHDESAIFVPKFIIIFAALVFDPNFLDVLPTTREEQAMPNPGRAPL